MSVQLVRALGVGGLAGCAVLGVVLAWRGGDRGERAGERQARSRLVLRLLALAGSALLLRAAFSLVQDGGLYDVFVSYRSVGERLRHGGDVYVPPTLGLANYPPVIYWWWALANTVAPAGHDHLFAAVVKAPFWIADAAVAPLLLLLIKGRRGWLAGWMYAVNPIAIAVATLHGQFDSLVVLPLLLAVARLPERPRTAGLLAGIAAAVKPWPFFFIAQLLARLPRNRWKELIGIAVAVPAAAFGLYALIHPGHLIGGIVRVIFYAPNWQGFGMGALLPRGTPYAVFAIVNLVALAAVIWVGVIAARRQMSPPQAVATGMLILLTLSATVSDQYLMWPMAFLLASGRPRLVALLGVGLLPAVACIDLWVSQNDGDAPRAFLFLATASMALAALAMLRPVRFLTEPSGREMAMDFSDERELGGRAHRGTREPAPARS